LSQIANNSEAVRADVRHRDLPLFFYGALLGTVGLSIYSVGILLFLLRSLLFLGEPFRKWDDAIILFSGLPCTLALLLAFADIALLLPKKRKSSRTRALPPLSDKRVVVALTAYNDAKSIAGAVADFRQHPLVRRVIVVDNNSADETAKLACEAGAQVVTELKPGYGQCVYRCFQEALGAEENSELIVLCEGDLTFRAADLEKLLT